MNAISSRLKSYLAYSFSSVHGSEKSWKGTNEYAVFKAFTNAHPEVPVVFARSVERETIQAAWNRGIKLSKAPYLCFLGADEGMHPDCLEQLYSCLQGNPDVDWAIADSIVADRASTALRSATPGRSRWKL